MGTPEEHPKPTAAAWEQRPNESDESYARFLLYRNLGPGRSVQTAYNLYTQQFRNAAQGHGPDAENSRKRLLVPGHWNVDSARHLWVDRSLAWDIDNLSRHGERLAALWIGILIKAAEKAAERLADPRVKPKDYMQCIALVDKLSAYLSPDAIRTLQPALGTHGGESEAKRKPDRAAVE